MKLSSIKFGLVSFGDYGLTSDGQMESDINIFSSIKEECILADELGIDYFLIGEHHNQNYAVSSPEIVADKLFQVITNLNLSNFHLRYGLPLMTKEQRLSCIELYGNEVIPRVKKMLYEHKRIMEKS